MNIVTILVTRSKSCHVKTLHTVLRINVQCLQKNINNQIVYVDDDPFLKAEMVQKYIKNNDRLIFIDFGIGMDDDSMRISLLKLVLIFVQNWISILSCTRLL